MVAITGHVRRKPMQRDLFTGELSDKKPKAGNGSHIVLKSTEIDRPHVAGMASWSGSGPAGKYCRDCKHFGAVAVKRPDAETIESRSTACLMAARRQGRIVQRADISISPACDQFGEPDGTERAWVVGPDGVVHAPDWHSKGGVPRFFILHHEPPADHPARAAWIAHLSARGIAR